MELTPDIQLQNFLSDLLLVALEDGVISDDENALLRQIKVDTKRLLQLIKEAKEDGIITDEERKQLDEFKKKFLSSAYELTKNDWVISKEERALMSALIKLLMHGDGL